MRRLILAAALLAMAQPAQADAGRRRCGDVNEDGVQDIGDAVLTLRAATGLEELLGEDHEAADVAPVEALDEWEGRRLVRNAGDRTLDVADAVAALRLAVGADVINNCPPFPAITGALPGWSGTCADGVALASVGGLRLLSGHAPLLVWVNGVPAEVVRTLDDGQTQWAWFRMPDLGLTASFENVQVRLVGGHGPVLYDGMRARDGCRRPSWASITPREARRDVPTVATIQAADLGDVCASGVRLVGRTTGIEVELGPLEPQSSSLRVTIPPMPGADGEPYDLVLQTACGSITEAGAWTWYRPEPPEITSVTPDAGPVEGGTPIRLRGRDLNLTTSLLVGTQQVLRPEWTLVSSEEIVATTPPAPTGSGLSVVAISASNRSHRDPTPVAFTYAGAAAPSCESVTPATAHWRGGTDVRITGSGLSSVVHVTTDGYRHDSLRMEDARTLVVTLRGVNSPEVEGPLQLHWGDGEIVGCPGTFTFHP